MKKVLHVIDSLDLGGAQTLLLDICNHADRESYSVEVACMHGRGVFTGEFEKAGIKVHSLSPQKWPPLYLNNFLRLLKSMDPDIIHFHLFGSNLIAKPLAALAGKRVLIVHDHCNDAGRGNPILLLADALSNRLASKVIAVSASIRDFLIRTEGIDQERVATISNGVDMEMFRPATLEQKISARLALRLPLESFVIGGVGRLVTQKNFTLFLKVAARVMAENPSVFFVIAGTGPLESQLHAEAEKLGITERVRFLGHVSDRVSLYHALDSLLMTSDFEGTPMTLLETMSSGVPVVASAVDGIAEVCTHGKNALLSPPGDLGSFRDSLCRLIAEGPLCEILGNAGRRTVVQNYDIRGTVRRVEQIYGDILGNF
jgi:glycosyltransferase involved in cell wall biosynthesis